MFARQLSSAAVLAALASTVSGIDWSAIDYHGHYFRQEWVEQPVVVERLDPILQPGVIGTHVHSFIGANAVSATTDFAAARDASCTQVYIQDDKSVYWFPSLYFQDPKNQSFTRVPEHHRVLYYFNRAADPDTGAENFDLIEEFPEGFRMIAGDSDLRSPAATKQLQNVVEWFCHGPDVKSSGFPGNFTSCPNGFAGSIRFPFCWNGDDFNPDDPHAHMSYPKTDAEGNGAPDSGPCPASHPKILPTIFFEFWFDTDSFDGLYEMGDTPWVVSNGDSSGYGFHADFLNGWTPGVLGKQMKECNIGESGEPLENCFKTWKSEGKEDVRENCSQKKSVSEETEGWLDALPGCNPIQAGPERAVVKSDCGDTATLAGGSVPASSAVSVASSAADSAASTAVDGTSSEAAPSATVSASAEESYSAPLSTVTSAAVSPVVTTEAAETTDSNGNVVYVTVTSYYTATGPAPTATSSLVSSSSTNVTLPADWTASGCHSDTVFPRSLSGKELAYWGEPVTSSGCAKYCDEQGFSIAGTEYGEQCFCGNELSQSDVLDAAKCDMECKGDAGEVCGGKGALSVFVKGGKSVKSRKRSQHFRKHVGGGASVRKDVF
ncbi:putative wsc domain protein [Neofusicoccum parvum UCRNP2]|uniref:Putative wsc domain protein n=1 Tax=Botryosphaeria parva (strain UCR-NP2) TaxID=1287680 RepID=R1EHJ1_BOTPV|nr:putative wsc domain protein [Neofusicoccum parvum UCRNP2]